MGKRRKLPPTITRGKQSTLGVLDSSDSDSTSTTLTGASDGDSHKRPRSGFFTSTKFISEKNEKNSPASAAAPNPTEFITGGVRVKFPFTPYKSQQDMMTKIVEALQKEENALLESPTGSGKSLALLCGALAWLESEKENRTIQRRSKYETIKQEIIESPYFADPALYGHPDTRAMSSSSSSNITTSCGTGCGTSLGSCGSRSERTVKEEPLDPGRPSLLADALASESRSRTASEFHSGSEDDDIFQVIKTLKMKQAVEIRYESEIPSLGTRDAERGGQKALAPNESRPPLPKIYFGSRTHKQITQLVKELKSNTVYRPKMAVLGGRNHYCVNPKLKKVVDKNDACQELLDAESCIYKLKTGDLFEKMVKNKKGQSRIWDMEDIIRKGNNMSACPYFAARSLALGAELIFCPYNYLIDPNIRKAMDIDLDNAIVILDEAHNIESTARDAGGLDVQHEDLKQANREFGDMIKYSVLENSCRKLMDLATMFLHILEEQTTFSIQNYEESTELWSSQDLINSLDKFGLNRRSIVSYRNACDEMSKALKDKKDMQKGRRPGQDRANLSEFEKEIRKQVITSPRVMRAMEGIVIIMERLLNCAPNDLDDYKIALVESIDRGRVQEEVQDSDDNQKTKKKTRNPYRQGHSVQKKKEILFWCLNPGVIFRSISTRARSVILTSGTLSPLDSFASELQTSFAITLEADHVVDKSHVWAGVLPSGPTKVRLDGTYKSVNTFEFQDELGRVIERVIATTPHGVLCFVSSYTIIDNLMKRWQQTGQYDKLSAIKEVILEPRKASNKVFDMTLKKFYTIIADEVAKGSNGGALLFAVYRGKCSEGIDFTDSNCRAVLAVSIPFPSLTDLKIKLKKEYNDQRSVRRPMQPQPVPVSQPQSLLDIDLQSINHSIGTSSAAPALPTPVYRPPILLSGKRWYEIQAFRAFNQAIGRCIRHRNDWGAMILLDHRFTQPHNRQSLSKWARPLAKTFPIFEDAMSDMQAWIAPLQRAQLEDSSSSSPLSAGATTEPAGGIAAMFTAIEGASNSSALSMVALEKLDKTTYAMAPIIGEARGAINPEPNSQTDIGAMWVIDTYGDRPRSPVDTTDLPLEQGIAEPVPDSAQDMVVDDDMDETHWVTPPEGSPELDLPTNEVPGNEEQGVLVHIAEDISMFSGDDNLDMSQSRQESPRGEDHRGQGNTGVDIILSDAANLAGSANTDKIHPRPVDGLDTGSSSSSGSGQQQQQNTPLPFGAPTFLRTNSLTSMMNSWQGTLTTNSATEVLPDGSIRILCKTCDEPLLICTSRPKIKTVHKSMAEDLLLNRRRVAGLSGASPFGTQVAHTHTQVQTQIPTTPTTPDQRQNFQRSNSNMSLTGGESSTSRTAGAGLPNAKIWEVLGSSVLQTPFDRQVNAEEYDCIWRPQDKLCYRRIMCPKCGQHELATAKAPSHERAIAGWRGVIVVTTTGGAHGSQDEAPDHGTAWLTPGEFRCA